VRFFLDENFPKTAAALLASRGHEAIDIRGTSLEGANDSVLFDLAQDGQAVFLTTDRDFFHTVPHLYDCHHGVVVVTLRQPNRANILERLEWFLDHFENTALENRVFRLKDETYRVLPTRHDSSSAAEEPGEFGGHCT